MSPHQQTIAEYDYDLPDERIARYPAPQRDGARQLHYRDGRISEAPFRELPNHLPAGSVLIGNRTRVIHARLHLPLPDGKRPVEIFCLDPLRPHDYALSLGSTEPIVWKCLIGGNRRWKRGPLQLDVPGGIRVTAERGERIENAFAITFSWTAPTPLSFGEVLAAAGTIPLPPYLGRAPEAGDADRYQTVFARQEGSVAAPTAGLHFTPAVLNGLAARDVGWRELTLHVGAGTFKPVTADTLGEHVMHREYFTVGRALVEEITRLLRARQKIVSVGTTSLRCLESLYYLGALVRTGRPPEEAPHVGQWAAADPELTAIPPAEALDALASHLRERGYDYVSGYTSLLLSPATRPRLADGLITNFHQPRSTLLLLVASLVGDDWRRIYDYALDHDFRFLSYGDSSLLWRRAELGG